MKSYYNLIKVLVVLFSLLLTYFYSIESFADSTPMVATHPQQPFPPDMQNFIDHMVTQYHFDRSNLINILSQADIFPETISSIEKPAEAKPWDFYQHFFLTPERISQGVAYWQQHQQTLAAAQQKYGVDPSIIIAIIGVETMYGSFEGKFQELGALTTLAFYHQARSPYFQNELAQFLLLARSYKLPPLALRGSYAGALGIPQFMPSSYIKYGTSYQNQARVNLFYNNDDAIMSVANYLHQFGWQAQQPIALPVKLKISSPPSWLVSTTAHPIYTLAALNKFGVNSVLALPAQQKAALIALHDSDHNEYWLAFPNFSTIMRYNGNTNYVMAVYQLSQAIRNHYVQQQVETSGTVVAAR